jgi:hypothetical protein
MFFLQRCPFGTFMGISVILLPSFRLRPMDMKVEKSVAMIIGATMATKKDKVS